MFPEPRDFLAIGVNARRPAPPFGGSGLCRETSVFSNPLLGSRLRCR